MQIASDEIVITMTREELRDLDRAIADAHTWWERTCPTQDIEGGPEAKAADAFHELITFCHNVTRRELSK